jgi:hypothetical protein
LSAARVVKPKHQQNPKVIVNEMATNIDMVKYIKNVVSQNRELEEKKKEQRRLLNKLAKFSHFSNV